MSSADTLTRIAEQIQRMRAIARMSDEHLLRPVNAISGWCPAEHLDHLSKVASSVALRIADREAKPAAKGINMIGRVILTIGRIPRGKGKSPERVYGTPCDSATLLASIEAVEKHTRALEAAMLADARGAIVPHPRFGGLTAAQALRFVAVHNDHHLRIVDEILSANAT